MRFHFDGLENLKFMWIGTEQKFAVSFGKLRRPVHVFDGEIFTCTIGWQKSREVLFSKSIFVRVPPSRWKSQSSSPMHLGSCLIHFCIDRFLIYLTKYIFPLISGSDRTMNGFIPIIWSRGLTCVLHQNFARPFITFIR